MSSFLLDTHVWLWFVSEPERIRPDIVERLRDSRSGLLLSAVSSLEIAIKWAAGRLELPEPPRTYVPSRMRRSNATGLAVEHAHALQVAALPLHHADPFDRLLIAQSQVERLPLVTADPAFDAYDVEVVKAT